MKLPRDVAGERLIRLLQSLGYELLRGKGSHVRMRHPGPPTHSVTVPRHDTLKIGTLHGILVEVAAMRSITIETLLRRL